MRDRQGRQVGGDVVLRRTRPAWPSVAAALARLGVGHDRQDRGEDVLVAQALVERAEAAGGHPADDAVLRVGAVARWESTHGTTVR